MIATQRPLAVGGAELPDSARRPSVWLSGGWNRLLIVGALAASVVAVWVTLDAGFLAYPDWLAAQKVDFILGPIAVGLYWRYKRPGNRLGLLLIVVGLVGVPYIFESATNPLLFGVG